MKYALIFCLIIMGRLMPAQEFKDIKLNNKLSILNDRAYFLFPDSAKNIARTVDIMSADPNAKRETRILFDRGTKRLVFFAQELFCLGSKIFLGMVNSRPAPGQNFQNKTLTEAGQLISVLQTPSSFGDSTRSAILINRLLVRTSDNTVFRIDAYINPDAFPERKEYQELSEDIFKTVTAGTRTNVKNARTEKIAVLGGKKDFVFDLPENYGITIDQQYDFQVIRLHKYLPYNDTNWTSITIYAGHHPSFFYPEYGFEAYNEAQEGTFIGEKISWFLFENRSEPLYLKEQKIPADKIYKGLVVHIAMTANTKAAIEESTSIIEKVKLK